MKAIDTPSDTSGQAHALQAEGIQAVGLYLRPDRASKAMVEGLHSVGIKCFSVYEKGHPDHAGYFTAEQGRHDGNAAVVFARQIGQPAASHIFLAVDYDASLAEIQVTIVDYVRAAREIIKAAGFVCSVYGSGLVCSKLISMGFANKGWLAQSHGWEGFEAFKPKAAIVQGKTATLLGLDIDWDTVIDPVVCW